MHTHHASSDVAQTNHYLTHKQRSTLLTLKSHCLIPAITSAKISLLPFTRDQPQKRQEEAAFLAACDTL